ncbi:MAG: DUF2922 domain-containing protein [Clostridiales bacterium]|nr:DUF2922 domain-containing protein [Clostridiales bacterium]
MQNYFKLFFGTNLDKKVTMTIPDAEVETPATAVKSAMANIIKDGIVESKGGTLNKALEAKLYEVDTIEYAVN